MMPYIFLFPAAFSFYFFFYKYILISYCFAASSRYMINVNNVDELAHKKALTSFIANLTNIVENLNDVLKDEVAKVQRHRVSKLSQFTSRITSIHLIVLILSPCSPHIS